MVTDTTFSVIYLSIAILLGFAFLFFAFWFGWWVSHYGQGKSPYTGTPLRRATELPYYSSERLLKFMQSFQQYDNRIFKLSRAAFCRDTGRIFQDCVTWYDAVHVDWTFLQKRYPGSYVSWGSLNAEQQSSIRAVHDSLEGFQTEFSSSEPSPRMIESSYAFAKPGPLYVDLETKVLLGWKEVPDTHLEVLIVQKPLSKIYS